MFSHIPFTILESKSFYPYFRDEDGLMRWFGEEEGGAY